MTTKEKTCDTTKLNDDFIIVYCAIFKGSTVSSTQLVKMEFGDGGKAAVTILGLTAFRNHHVMGS